MGNRHQLPDPCRGGLPATPPMRQYLTALDLVESSAEVAHAVEPRQASHYAKQIPDNERKNKTVCLASVSSGVVCYQNKQNWRHQYEIIDFTTERHNMHMCVHAYACTFTSVHMCAHLLFLVLTMTGTIPAMTLPITRIPASQHHHKSFLCKDPD